MKNIKNIEKVDSMLTPRGSESPDHFIIYTDTQTIFISYDKPIVIKGNDGKIKLDINNWKYSQTTIKYRNQFLNENQVTTKKKIASGEYELADLSKLI
jgi:hypothetical protein